VEQDFPGLGHKTLLLNARRLKREPGAAGMILLAFEDATSGAPELKPRPRRKD